LADAEKTNDARILTPAKEIAFVLLRFLVGLTVCMISLLGKL